MASVLSAMLRFVAVDRTIGAAFGAVRATKVDDASAVVASTIPRLTRWAECSSPAVSSGKSTRTRSSGQVVTPSCADGSCGHHRTHQVSLDVVRVAHDAEPREQHAERVKDHPRGRVRRVQRHTQRRARRRARDDVDAPRVPAHNRLRRREGHLDSANAQDEVAGCRDGGVLQRECAAVRNPSTLDAAAGHRQWQVPWYMLRHRICVVGALSSTSAEYAIRRP